MVHDVAPGRVAGIMNARDAYGPRDAIDTRPTECTKESTTMSGTNPGATFPRLLQKHAAERGAHPATREKDLGIWQTWTWSQVAAEVRALACGLAASGF